MKRVIVGEGSYGCVHNPGIHCKTPPKPGFNYSTYVSKIMKTKHAKKELDKFLIVNNIDPTDEYHLGKPILCQPDLDVPSVKKDISKCKRIKLKDIEEEPDNYSLLLMKFGGPNLKLFCNKYISSYLKVDKQVCSDKFWLEVHHLLKGVKFFKQNNLVHNDIKPHNILFNPKDGSMKFIDFGLMRTKSEILKSSESSNNNLGVFHWSYPFDCGFMNNNIYKKYKSISLARKTFWKNQLSELIINDSEINTLDLPINNPDSFSVLFTYINPDNTVPDEDTQYGYIESFFDGFNEMIEQNSYEKVLEFITDSVDIFSLGITLQFMANCFNRHNAFNLPDFIRLTTFLNKMCDFNPLTRVIDIDVLINEYENVLLEIGVLTRLGKKFENNLLVIKDLKVARKKIINCPPEKELNPKTNRCNKKCKMGFFRNEKFRCRKTKKNYKKNSSIKKNLSIKKNSFEIKSAGIELVPLKNIK